jgi:hypothetical protein
MTEALFILIAIELGMRVFPLLDSFVELLNHLIAIGINKCDCVIRKDALKCEEEELKRTNNSLPVIGFRAGDDSYEEAPEDDECDED